MKEKIIIIALAILSFVVTAEAANPKISLRNTKTGEEVSYANVFWQEIGNAKSKGRLTADKDGNVELDLPVGKEVSLSIFHVSCKAYQDTIILKEKQTLELVGKTHRSETVLVTGTRTHKTVENTPVLTKVVSSFELEEAGAENALEALEYSMPGVQFSPDAHGDNLQIQGLDNKYILVMVNGERLVGETRGNVNFNRIDVNNIEHIEIINGASSVLYGSNAIGAIINIITKENEKEFQGRASSAYSTADKTTRNSLNIGLKKGKFGIDAGAFFNASEGFDMTPETPQTATVNPYYDLSANLGVNYKANDNLSFSLKGKGYGHEVRNPDASLNSTHKREINTSGSFSTVFKHSKNNILQLKANMDKYTNYTVFEKMDNDTEVKAEYAYNTISATETIGNIDKLEMVVGGEVNMEDIYSLNLFGKTESSEKNKDAQEYNAFAQADWQLLENLEIVGGMRYNYHSEYGHHYTPKIAIMFSPCNFKLRANIATGYKAPTLKELYYNFDHQGMFWIIGNPDLKPESAFYTSVSGEWISNDFDFTITGYRNSIQDKIEMIQRMNIEKDRFEFYHENISQALLMGVETYVSYSFLNYFRTRIGYSYSDATDKSTNLEMYGNSRHTGTFSLTASLRGKFPSSITLSGLANSGRIYQYYETEKNEETGEEIQVLYDKKSDPYTMWKINYVQKFQISKYLGLNVTLGLKNLFNYQDTKYYASIDPGRRFYGSIELVF